MREFYQQSLVSINGVNRIDVQLEEISTKFYIQQIFCSCPAYPSQKDIDRYGTNITVLNDNCGCAKDRGLKYLGPKVK